jgi:hypothetical protein
VRLKACYTVRELAEDSGLTRWQVIRLLNRAGISSRIGRQRVVYLSVLRKSLPELWESMVYMEQLRQAI